MNCNREARESIVKDMVRKNFSKTKQKDRKLMDCNKGTTKYMKKEKNER